MAKRFTAAFVAIVLLLTPALRAHDPLSGIEAAGLFRGYRTVLQIDPVLIVPFIFPPYVLPVALFDRRADVYGLNTGIVTPMAGDIYGLSCPLLFCKADSMSGISLTTCKSTFGRCQGLSVAAWQNIDEINCPALTVALWQECSRENRGVQLGLVNTVRATPYRRNVQLADLPKSTIYDELRKEKLLDYVQSYVTTIPGNAAQIGVFNSASDGLQIGIINRNPNSWLPYSPLFNFSRSNQPVSQRMVVSGLDLATWTTFSYTVSGLHLPSQTVSEVIYKTIQNKSNGDLANTEHFRKHRLGRSQPIHLIWSIIEYDQDDKITRHTTATYHGLNSFSKIIKFADETDRDIVLDSYDKLIAWRDQPKKLCAIINDRSDFFRRKGWNQGRIDEIAAKGGNEPAYVTLAWQTLFPKNEDYVLDTFRHFRLRLKEQGITTADMLAQHPELLDQLFFAPDDLSLASISDAVLDLFFVTSRFSPNQQDVFGRTPLMRILYYATKRTHSPLDWQRVLARFNSYGMDWSLADAEGKGYLDYAVALQVNDMDAVLDPLLGYCNTTLPKANAPCHRLLVNARSIDNIKSLVDRGLDLNAKDEKGRTLLHARPVMVKELVKLGMDINAKDNKGNTPLVYLRNYISFGTSAMLDSYGKIVTPDNAGKYIREFTELQTPPVPPKEKQSQDR